MRENKCSTRFNVIEDIKHMTKLNLLKLKEVCPSIQHLRTGGLRNKDYYILQVYYKTCCTTFYYIPCSHNAFCNTYYILQVYYKMRYNTALSTAISLHSVNQTPLNAI